MSEAFWEKMDAAQNQMIINRRPRLKKPKRNAMCTSQEDYDVAIGDQWIAAKKMAPYRPARETHFKDTITPSAHVDRESTAAIRFWIYLHGDVDLEHMWDAIKDWWGKAHFRDQKRRCAGVERHTSLLSRRAVFGFVVRSVHRTGGLRFWRKRSRFQDRDDCFEAGYDELLEHCDNKVYREEGKSASIRNIHALDTNPATMDATNPRHAYRQSNKLRFLYNCEAVWRYLFDGPDGEPCQWATEMAWKISARISPLTAIKGLSTDAKDVPGRPFGVFGEEDRMKVPYVIDAPERMNRG